MFDHKDPFLDDFCLGFVTSPFLVLFLYFICFCFFDYSLSWRQMLLAYVFFCFFFVLSEYLIKFLNFLLDRFSAFLGFVLDLFFFVFIGHE